LVILASCLSVLKLATDEHATNVFNIPNINTKKPSSADRDADFACCSAKDSKDLEMYQE